MKKYIYPTLTNTSNDLKNSIAFDTKQKQENFILEVLFNGTMPNLSKISHITDPFFSISEKFSFNISLKNLKNSEIYADFDEFRIINCNYFVLEFNGIKYFYFASFIKKINDDTFQFNFELDTIFSYWYLINFSETAKIEIVQKHEKMEMMRNNKNLIINNQDGNYDVIDLKEPVRKDLEIISENDPNNIWNNWFKKFNWLIIYSNSGYKNDFTAYSSNKEISTANDESSYTDSFRRYLVPIIDVRQFTDLKSSSLQMIINGVEYFWSAGLSLILIANQFANIKKLLITTYCPFDFEKFAEKINDWQLIEGNLFINYGDQNLIPFKINDENEDTDFFLNINDNKTFAGYLYPMYYERGGSPVPIINNIFLPKIQLLGKEIYNNFNIFQIEPLNFEYNEISELSTGYIFNFNFQGQEKNEINIYDLIINNESSNLEFNLFETLNYDESTLRWEPINFANNPNNNFINSILTIENNNLIPIINDSTSTYLQNHQADRRAKLLERGTDIFLLFKTKGLSRIFGGFDLIEETASWRDLKNNTPKNYQGGITDEIFNFFNNEGNNKLLPKLAIYKLIPSQFEQLKDKLLKFGIPLYELNNINQQKLRTRKIFNYWKINKISKSFENNIGNSIQEKWDAAFEKGITLWWWDDQESFNGISYYEKNENKE